MQCELLHQEAMSHNKEFKAGNYVTHMQSSLTITRRSYVPHQEFKVDSLVYEGH